MDFIALFFIQLILSLLFVVALVVVVTVEVVDAKFPASHFR